MDDAIAGFADIINETMDTITRNFYKESPLDKTWKRVLYSMGSDGEKLFEHTRVAISKNNSTMLDVTTDNGGWKQLLQLHTSYILRGFSMYARDMQIDSIRVTVKNENSVWCG